MATENKKYIPTLRFPEFQNDGEWKRCKLSDVAVRKGKKNTKGIELPVYTNSATSGVISQEDYFDREIVTKENLVNYGIIEPNDFVYNPRVSVTAPVGPISRNKLSRGIMSPLYLIFGFNGGDINFFEHYFKGNSWHNYLRAKANYGARFDRINIGTKEFMDMPIPYPSLAEQKKIADCLSSLDKYIDATKRKLELLKEYKKGLMQRLFPAKGKTTPEIRFPEFQNDGEWKIVLLKDFTERIKSKVGNAQLRPISISAGIGFVDQKNKFGRDISGNQYSNYIVLKKGEFAYNKGNSIKYPQGCVYQLKEFEIVACPNVFVCFRIINNSVCPDFMSAYFASNYHGKQLQQYITSGVRSNGLLNISAETFLGIKTPLPSLSEQKKIADCLSSLDKYIDATKRKLELLKEHKKGLMQRLFPAKGKTTPELRFPEFQNNGEWNYEHGDILYDSIANKKHKSDLPILAITQENGAIPRDEINYRVIVEDKSIEGYKVVEIGDFIISLRSFQGGIEYSRYKGLCSPAYIVLRKRHSKIYDDFYRHYFKSFQYIKELNRNLEGIRDGKMVSYKQFADIKLPNPCYEEQCKIAKVLSSIDDVIQTHIEKISALELHKNGLMQQLFPKL